MSVKSAGFSCCGCFGQKKEKTQEIVPIHHQLRKQERFHSYRPTDVNQMISDQIDQKAKKEAEIAAEVFKNTEK